MTVPERSRLNDFIVKENFGSKNNLFIHVQGCGVARRPGHRTYNTEWHGYFATYGEAHEFAVDRQKQYGRRDAQDCRRPECFRSVMR